MNENQSFSLRQVTRIGIMAAMIFALTKYISIPIPSPLGKTALSLGNSLCLLTALLFGPVTGGLAAGIGNALVDLTDPAWAAECWITFINKFAMAWVAGILMQLLRRNRDEVRIWLAGLGGALTYCILYILKNLLLGVYKSGFTWTVAAAETLTVKLPVTLVNGCLAVICAGALYLTLRRPLHKAHVLPS